MLNNNLEKKIAEEENKLRKVTFLGSIYLILTVIIKNLFGIFNLEIKRKRKNFDEIYSYFIKKKTMYF